MPDTPPTTDPQPIQFLPEDMYAEQDAEILRLTQENFDLRRALRAAQAQVRTLQRVQQSLMEQMKSPDPDGDGEPSLQVVDPADEISDSLDEELGAPSKEEMSA